jgi:hypothetical protein
MTATEVHLKGSSGNVKLRDPVRVALLDLCTLGIYGFVWYYRVHRELAELGRARGDSGLGDNPRRSLLALVPGLLLIVPAIVSLWNAPERVEAAQRLAGESEPELVNRILAFILMLIVFPVGAAYVQAQLNKVWATEAEMPSDGHSVARSEAVVSS